MKNIGISGGINDAISRIAARGALEAATAASIAKQAA